MSSTINESGSLRASACLPSSTTSCSHNNIYNAFERDARDRLAFGGYEHILGNISCTDQRLPHTGQMTQGVLHDRVHITVPLRSNHATSVQSSTPDRASLHNESSSSKSQQAKQAMGSSKDTLPLALRTTSHSYGSEAQQTLLIQTSH